MTQVENDFSYDFPYRIFHGNSTKSFKLENYFAIPLILIDDLFLNKFNINSNKLKRNFIIKISASIRNFCKIAKLKYQAN